jgi:transmembrane sensor
MLHLFKKYLNDQCSPAEVEELLAHFNVQENELLLRNIIMQNLGMEDTSPGSKAVWSNAVDETYARIKKQIAAEKNKMTPIFKRRWFQVAAAAILLLGVFTFYKLGLSKNDIKQQVAKTNSADIAPGSNKAVLTLADGSQIILDSAANGNLTNQGNTTVIKLDGKLAYTASGNNGEVLYNTISTPKGGMYQIVLSDGSKVWLNAASSLRFPTAFTGKQRNVELSGEAYFEIAKNAAMPFNVLVNNMNVQVLGTHFNVMAYKDESEIKTTLLEGAVKVTSGSAVGLLKPGKQARLDNSGNIIIADADIETEMAWKNGLFLFDYTDIKTIMRQLNRWYDADIGYEGNITHKTFTAQIPRNTNLSAVLKKLELTGGIHFKIEGKKILVMP